MTPEMNNNVLGHMEGIGLPSFLQMIEMEQQTCTVKVFNHPHVGYIYLNHGQIVDAKTETLFHAQALYQILSWRVASIEVKKNVTVKENRISLPLMHILIESMRKIDDTGASDTLEDAKPTPGVHGRHMGKKVPVRILYNENFCLEIGIKLLVEFDHQSDPFQSKLVGMEPGKFLVVKAPESITSIHQTFPKIRNLIVKTLYKGTVYAFQSKLKSLISRPSRLMFINYPQKIEHHELRLFRRYKCSIVTETQINRLRLGGVIENISKGGCLLALEKYITDRKNPVDLIRRKITFRCYFPNANGEVNLLGEVRNLKEDTDEMYVGVEFEFPKVVPDIRNIIYDYIRLIEASGENV